MSGETIAARIDTILGALTGAGQVHDYQRWAVTWPKFLELFKITISGAKVIRGWMIARGPVKDQYLDFDEDDTSTGASVIRTYSFRIYGIYGHNDADESEKAAWALSIAALSALQHDGVLHDGDTLLGQVQPASLDVFELRMFDDALVHWSEISLEAKELIAV